MPITSRYKFTFLIGWVILATSSSIFPLVLTHFIKNDTSSIFFKIFCYAAFASLFLTTVYTFIKRAPIISFTESGITVSHFWRKKIIQWHEVQSVTMHQKIPFPVKDSFRQRYEALVIYCQGNEKVIICDDLYSNISSFRQYILNSFPETMITDLNGKINPAHAAELYERLYRGNPWFHFYTIILLLFTTFVITLISSNHFHLPTPSPLLFIMFGFILLMYLGMGYQMHYFIIDRSILTVKNHYFFWVVKTFNLEDIKEMVAEHPYKKSNALRIITKDGQSCLFIAGSLRKKHWRSLRDDALYLGVPFRCDTDID